MSGTTESQDLEFTRDLRKRLISDMTKDNLPTDNRDRITLLAALNDMDRSALAVMKIKSDEGIGNKAAEAQAIIAAMLTHPDIKKIGRAEVIDGATRVVDDLPEGVGVVDVLPDELSTNHVTEGYEDFMKRTG